jgi:hypothetical protein
MSSLLVAREAGVANAAADAADAAPDTGAVAGAKPA